MHPPLGRFILCIASLDVYENNNSIANARKTLICSSLKENKEVVMKRIILIVLLAVCLVAPTSALAKKTTYIVTNKRLNYVKLVEVKPAVMEERGMTHPVDIPTEKMRQILASLKLSKTHLIGDKVDSREIYDERAINYLAPALSRAFREAKPNEEVQFSYVVKNPLIILRNDRLTMVDAWISGNDLYLEFKKLYAKLTGDTDKRGNYSKIISRAKGLRVSLELGPGQQMASVGSKTMVIDLSHSFAPIASSKSREISASASVEDEPTKSVRKPRKSKYSRKRTTKSEETVATTSETATEPQEKSITERLEELDTLRKRNLISSKEYKTKKAEILKDL